jgi:tetratricopeptide (TPR) repeat protein
MRRRGPLNLPPSKTKRQPPPLPAGEGRGEGELNKQLIKTSSGLSARPRQILLWSGAILIAAACFWRTVVEVQYWKDGITLLNRAIALDPQNDMAWMSLGSEYYNRGNYARAIDYMTRATTLNPSSNLAWHFLGKLLARNGDNAGAQNAYQTSLQYASFNGDRKDTYNDLGDSFASAGQYDQAVAAYQSSLQLSPDQPDTQVKIGQCFLQIQSADQADAAFQAALDLQPDNSDAHAGLGMILQSQGRDADAITHYRQALAARPDSLLALNNLAWLLATDSDPTLRNGPQAVTLAKRACEQTHYQKAFLIGTLAAAYAEAGQFDDAIAAAQKARDVATTNGETDLAARNTQLLKLYQSHHPFHQP